MKKSDKTQPNYSLHKQIEGRIQDTKPGVVLFPSEFLELGTADAIHKTFSRLVRQGKIMRLAKGIYLKPKNDPLLGLIQPSLEEIAHQIAEREKVIIRPTGAYALNKLGISTQVPTKVVFLTNGSRRMIRVGKATINFKPTTPKKLAAENETVFLAIQALLALGEKGTTERVISTLTERLRPISPDTIRADARTATQHVAQTLIHIASNLENHD